MKVDFFMKKNLQVNRNSVLRDMIKEYDLYLMALVPLGFLIVFKYFPLMGLIISFQNFDIFSGFFKSEWVGLANFRELFSEAEFYVVLRNTIIISLYKLIFLFPAPIILAIMINEVKNVFFKRTVQTIVYLPHFISWVVIAGLFFDILSSNGTVNKLIFSLGGEKIKFLMDERYFRSILVISDGWKEVGWSAIIYLSAILSIDQEQYEAGRVDGAGRLRLIWNITIPGIMPTIVLLLLIRIGNLMNAGMEQIMAMYNPTVYSVSDIISTYVYRVGLGQQRYSYSTAAGVFESTVGFIMIMSANTFSRKFLDKGLW